MLPVQYEMKVMAKMTDILVRPAVLELISAHPEKDGMVNLKVVWVINRQTEIGR